MYHSGSSNFQIMFIFDRCHRIEARWHLSDMNVIFNILEDQFEHIQRTKKIDPVTSCPAHLSMVCWAHNNTHIPDNDRVAATATSYLWFMKIVIHTWPSIMLYCHISYQRASGYLGIYLECPFCQNWWSDDNVVLKSLGFAAGKKIHAKHIVGGRQYYRCAVFLP